ncbi:MAG: hypothetical protein ABJE95_40095 [Byssovorax sp.]
MPRSARFAAIAASALLALLWAACGGKVVVDGTQLNAAGAGGAGGTTTTAGPSTVAASSSTGTCSLCSAPTTCVTTADCCVGACMNGACIFFPPAGLYCCNDSQCVPGTTCDVAAERCRCMTDAQCFGVNPTCDTDAGLCH